MHTPIASFHTVMKRPENVARIATAGALLTNYMPVPRLDPETTRTRRRSLASCVETCAALIRLSGENAAGRMRDARLRFVRETAAPNDGDNPATFLAGYADELQFLAAILYTLSAYAITDFGAESEEADLALKMLAVVQGFRMYGSLIENAESTDDLVERARRESLIPESWEV